MNGSGNTSPSMKALAALCGVSSMTVSRSLRNDRSVAAATRRKVRAAAARAGYRVQGHLGRPRRGAAAAPPAEIVIGVGLGEGNLYHARLVVAIERELSVRGRDCLIRTCDGNYDRFLALCDALRRTRPEDLMILGYFPRDRLESLLSLTPRPLLLDQSLPVGLNGATESIGFDNVAAARLAVGHLLDRGFRRILLLKGPEHHYFSQDIDRGYRELLQERRLPADPGLIATADFTAEGARQAVGAALAAGLSFDAVFTNDEMALGVLRALHEAGLAVPGRVAVAGCDGLPFGAHAVPSLTTVALDYESLGRLVVDRLAARARHPRPVCRMLLAPALVVRESTGG